MEIIPYLQKLQVCVQRASRSLLPLGPLLDACITCLRVNRRRNTSAALMHFATHIPKQRSCHTPPTLQLSQTVEESTLTHCSCPALRLFSHRQPGSSAGRSSSLDRNTCCTWSSCSLSPSCLEPFREYSGAHAVLELKVQDLDVLVDDSSSWGRDPAQLDRDVMETRVRDQALPWCILAAISVGRRLATADGSLDHLVIPAAPRPLQHAFTVCPLETD